MRDVFSHGEIARPMTEVCVGRLKRDQRGVMDAAGDSSLGKLRLHLLAFDLRQQHDVEVPNVGLGPRCNGREAAIQERRRATAYNVPRDAAARHSNRRGAAA